MGKGKNERKRRAALISSSNSGNGNGISNHYFIIGPGGTVTSVKTRMEALPYFGR